MNIDFPQEDSLQDFCKEHTPQKSISNQVSRKNVNIDVKKSLMSIEQRSFHVSNDSKKAE